MAGHVMSVRLWLPQIEVLEVVADAPERLSVPPPVWFVTSIRR